MGERRLVQQAPGQHPGRIVEEELTRDQEERPGNDGGVDGKPVRIRLGRQAYLPWAGVGLTLAPQEQTMLRVAHWMLSRRPQARQLR
ncbi:MAG: hypothetical protein DMF80_12010 [Acidobacteria bacterium]|nr:MAG: hypothetical protein DMF80_12010 [Acidobacteriota bacterium]PYQ19696.1 MAG: hypothetical protein DMF81_21040 [Acidobacteriota bacterium]